MRKPLITLLLLLALIAADAQTAQFRWLTGTLADCVTLLPIEGFTSVQMLKGDSVVSEGYATKKEDKGKSSTHFTLPVVEGDFLLRITNNDYKVYQDSLRVVFRKRESSIKFGRVLLKRRMTDKPIDLADVVVKATRIKFYFDNDTLVYDAAAFTTQKGFVLNDVLRKMPGLEIKPNGDIFSNGRRIEELLLNGKNFFNRDRKTILENLPGFMLKNVKVYEKTKDSTAAIRRDREVQGLVMDLQLKKEYASTALFNGDIAYGTDTRYYGKLFGMKFHSLYRLSGYATTNNINRNEDFGNDGIGVNTDDDAGDKKTTLAGIRYDIDHSQGTYALEGDAKFSYVDRKDKRDAHTEQFFSSGNVIGHANSIGNNYSTSFSTTNKIYLLGNTACDFTLKPSLSYKRTVGNSASLDSTENINRMLATSLGTDDKWDGSLTIDKSWHANHSGDYLKVSLTGYFAGNKSKSYRDYKLRTLVGNGTDEWQNKYMKNDFTQRQWHGYGVYHYAPVANTGVEASYTYDNVHGKRDYSLYNLNQLPEWNANEKLGSLPSMDRLREVIDEANSRWTTQDENNHELKLSYHFRKMSADKGSSELYVGMPLRYKDCTLHYRNLSMDTTARQRQLLANVVVNAAKSIKLADHSMYFFRLSYYLTQHAPAIDNLIDVKNDAVPLFVTQGNPNLKNSVDNTVDGIIQLQPKGFGNHTLDFRYTNTSNKVVQSLLYDKATGTSYIRPVNVSGNWKWHFGVANKVYIGKAYSASLGNKLQFDIAKDAQMVGTTGEGTLVKSMVRQSVVSEVLELSCHFNKERCHLQLTPYYTYSHVSSPRNGFQSFSTHDFGGKAKIGMELVADIRFTSSLSATFRRGYLFREMNDEELLWNADISKSFSKITIAIGINDILNNKRNVSRYVNAEKRTEQYYNSIGRYALLRLSWHINDKRKK